MVEFPSLDDGKRITNQMIASLVISLRKAVAQQTSIIEAARAEIREIKTEQKALKGQNTELQEEIQTLRAQIETQATTNPPPKSWAEVAASNSPYNTNTIIHQPQRELNCIRISTARHTEDHNDKANNNTFTRFLPTDTANNYIRTALANTGPTKDVQVAGVGTTKTGYVIRFRDAQSAETAQNNTAWLEELGNKSKLVKPQFSIVVY